MDIKNIAETLAVLKQLLNRPGRTAKVSAEESEAEHSLLFHIVWAYEINGIAHSVGYTHKVTRHEMQSCTSGMLMDSMVKRIDEKFEQEMKNRPWLAPSLPVSSEE